MRTPLPSTFCLGLVLLLTGCGDKDTGEARVPACGLSEAYATCDECYSGEVTCTFGDQSETAGSCGDCQARGALYASLCEAGIDDSVADIEAGTTCSEPR